MKLLLKTDNNVRVIADSAIGRNLQPWFLPECGTNWRWRLAAAFRVSRLGKNVAPKFADRHIDATTLLWVAEADGCGSLDFMDGAIVCGQWLPIGQVPEKAAEILAKVSELSTMKTGDIIGYFLNDSVQPIEIGQHISQTLDDTEVLSFNIK